jgi:ABC-2 type transport system permease protein
VGRIFTIAKKDIVQIFSNKFIAVITFLAIFVYALIYFLLPTKVDESFKIGFHLENKTDAIEKTLSEAEGIEIKWAGSQKALRQMIEAEEVETGFSIVFIEDTPTVKFFVSSRTPKEIREAGEIIGREIAYSLLGLTLPVEIEQKIVGVDKLGSQIPLRDKMRILFVITALVVEIYALANLLVEEVQRKTAFALLVTPVRLREFMSAKAIVGVLLAFTEGMIVALLMGVLTLSNLLAVSLLVFLGSILVTAIAFIIGSYSRDFLSMTVLGTLPLLVLMIPGIVLVAPATFSPLMNAIPTYHLVSALDGVVNYGTSFSQYSSQILYLAAFDVLFFIAGYAILKRKVT